MSFLTEVAESNALTATSCKGKLVNTLTGQLTLLGFQPPIAYTTGVSFTVSDGTKTVDEGGLIYAPIPSALPFTTSGTFVGDDDARFFLVQGVYLYGGQVIILKGTVASMASDASLQIGNVVFTEGYTTVGDSGSVMYEIVAGGTGTDDGGSIIDLAASGLQARALSLLEGRNVIQWGAIGDGATDDTVAVQAAIDYVASIGGGTLQFPVTSGGSVYKLNVTARAQVRLLGANRLVQLIPAIDAPVIDLDPNAHTARVTIETLTIDGVATKLTFTAQDGIRSAPADGFIHALLTVINVVVRDCGAAGIALVGGAASGTGVVTNTVVARTGFDSNEGPGVLVYNNVRLTSVNDCAIINNGNEAADDQSNVVLKNVLGDFPEEISFTSCHFITGDYLVGGNAIAIMGALGVALRSCLFSDFLTGIKLPSGAANGQVTVRDCSFERAAGNIVALANVERVHGFVWDNNNVHALTVGPVGVAINGPATDVINLDISPFCSWGGLDKSTDLFPENLVSATAVSLSQRGGLVQINLAADGAQNLDDIYDEHGGEKQFTTGNIVTLRTSSPTRDVTVRHGLGNVRLNGGVDMVMDNTAKTLMLMWGTGHWIEVSRSDTL